MGLPILVFKPHLNEVATPADLLIMPSDSPRSRRPLPKAQPVKSPHTPGPWATLPGEDGSFEVWTALPTGALAKLGVVYPGPHAQVDATLMSAAPQLAHEIRSSMALLEKLISTPKVLDALIEATQNTELEAALVHRLGCLRHLAQIMGPALTAGSYEPFSSESRWYVPEHAYRTREEIEE